MNATVGSAAARGPAHRTAPSEIRLLVFERAGWRFAVETRQVEALVGLPRPPAPGEPVTFEYQGQVRPAWSLGDWLGLDDAGWQPSRVLVARCGAAPRAFLVDMPLDVVTLPLEAVYPLPALVARTLGPSPFWGVADDRAGGGLILLVDLALCPASAPRAAGSQAEGEDLTG